MRTLTSLGLILALGLFAIACELGGDPGEDTTPPTDTVSGDTSPPDPGCVETGCPDGQVCDTGTGQCLQCTQDAHCPADGLCTVGVCLEGTCKVINVPDLMPCDDGDPCTMDDQCQAGQCLGVPDPDCEPPPTDLDDDGFTIEDGDCDDDNPEVHPGADEICEDGLDNDCQDGDADCPTPDCVISGCSGEICAEEPMDSTCEWLPEYECLPLTQCGHFGPDGACGWEQNEEYLDCLNSLCVPVPEICGDDLDNDCDGKIDEDCGGECLGPGETYMGQEELCCPGLTAAHDCEVIQGDCDPSLPECQPFECLCPKCLCFVCVACGDGVCGPGENLCTCQEDCEPSCYTPKDCDDSDPCTEDVCVGGECAHETIPDCGGDCVPAGGTAPVIPNAPPCCDGLQKISIAEYDPVTDLCMYMDGAALCSDCGDGFCEEWENVCNCADDCSGPPDAMALCAQTGGQWTDCGSGCGPWACGEPLPWICPAVCIPQCACPADAPGWDPDQGCVKCGCDDWMETWQALMAQVSACETPDDCASVPATSCGCTHNKVVNKDYDLTMFWALAEQMGDAGCSPFMSTCDCPPADGYACVNGQCQWNYL